MKTSLILKINFLFLALFVVIMVMVSLNRNGLPPSVQLLFGLDSSGVAQGNQKVSWCDTRVEALIVPEQYKLEQVKLKWFIEDSARREVDGLAVEKWFGRYCAVRGVLASLTEDQKASFKPALFVKFITNQVEALGRNDEGLFLWRGQAFRSEELTQALSELNNLPVVHGD